MNLVQSFLTNNPCYKSNLNRADSRYTTFQNRGPIGLMLHSVGCNQPNAQVFINNWNKASYDRACVHGFIDANSGTVYQCMPWNYRAWHCAGSGNNTHVGVEMCEPATIHYTGVLANFTVSDPKNARAAAKRTYLAAVELFASLCKEYKLDPLKKGVIVSHKEGCAQGIASNHGDPEHLWGGLNLGYTMDTFRAAVKAELDRLNGNPPAAPQPDPVPEAPKPEPEQPKPQLYRVRKTWADSKSQKGAYKILANAKACADKNPGYTVFNADGKAVYPEQNSVNPAQSSTADTPQTGIDTPFKVQVTIPDLNIRRGPGTNYAATGLFTGKGFFTITEVQPGQGSAKGWGKLKSGAGWIALDHTTRV